MSSIKVVSVATFDPDGKLLLGLRRDSFRWCCPGGHVEAGEALPIAAARELAEEAGITVDPKELVLLGEETVEDGDRTIVVTSFEARVGAVAPSAANDPDNEMFAWFFVDVTGGLPEPYCSNLHNKHDVTLSLLGLDCNDSDRLEKGWGRKALTTAAFIGGLHGGLKMTAPPEPEPAPIEEPMSEPTPEPTHIPPGPRTKDSTGKWSAGELPTSLERLAHIESSYGRNLNHPPDPRGPWETAYGALGVKPSTGHWSYGKDKALQERFPGLHDKEKFHERFKSDHHFYNAVAESFWNWLLKRHGSYEEAAVAWEHGSEGVKKMNRGEHPNPNYKSFKDTPRYTKYTKILNTPGGMSEVRDDD